MTVNFTLGAIWAGSIRMASFSVNQSNHALCRLYSRVVERKKKKNLNKEMIQNDLNLQITEQTYVLRTFTSIYFFSKSFVQLNPR